MAKSLSRSMFSPSKLYVHKRIRDWIGGRVGLEELYPITMELGPSGPGNCNNHCGFCMHGGYYDVKAMMDFDFYRGIVDQLGGLRHEKTEDTRVKGMIFSASGEPATNPRISDFLKYTRESGMDVALISNGSLWRRKEGLVEATLKYANWTRTSLDAGTPQTRAKVHGVGIGDYDNVLEGLRMLAEQKKATGSRCQVGAQITVTEDNWREIERACADVKSTGIDYFQIKPVIFHPKDGKSQLPNDFWEKVVGFAKVVEELHDGDGFDVWVKYDQFGAIMAPNHEQGTYSRCLARIWPIIEATGDVFYCSQTRGLPEFWLGNLHEQTFQEIWKSERRRQVNNSIDVTKCQPVCRCLWDIKELEFIVDVTQGKHASSFT